MAPPFQEENKGKAAKPAPLRGCALSPSSVRPERLRRRQRSCLVHLVTQFSPLLPQSTPPPRQTPPLGGTRQYFLPCDTYWRSISLLLLSHPPSTYLSTLYHLSTHLSTSVLPSIRLPFHPSICPSSTRVCVVVYHRHILTIGVLRKILL